MTSKTFETFLFLAIISLGLFCLTYGGILGIILFFILMFSYISYKIIKKSE